MEGELKLTQEQKETISTFIGDIRKSKDKFNDDIKKNIDSVLEKMQEISSAEETKNERLEEIINELERIGETDAEIDFIAFSLKEIKNEAGESEKFPPPRISPLFTLPNFQRNQTKIDDPKTCNENTSLIKSRISKIIKPIIVEVRKEPVQKEKIYRIIFKSFSSCKEYLSY